MRDDMILRGILAAFVGISSMGYLQLAQAVPVSGQGTWETTLQARDLDGDFANGAEAYYDTSQNITWLADANYYKTVGKSSTGLLSSSFSVADSYSGLYHGYGFYSIDIHGVSGWSMPTAGVRYEYVGVCGSGYATYPCNPYPFVIQGSSPYQMLFENILGNRSQDGSYALENTGPFSNIQSGNYLTSVFSTDSGLPAMVTYSSATGLYATGKGNWPSGYAMFVKAGDVGVPVPVPEASTWVLMAFGLAGVWLVRARRSRQLPA